MEVQEHTEETASGQEPREEGRDGGHAPDVPSPAPGGRRRGGDHGGSWSSTVVLGPRDQLNGRLVTEGDVRIQGTLEGELQSQGDVEVDARAVVRASIEARNVSIRGEVVGDTIARERLTLGGTGTLTGNVRVQRLSIEDGATLNGSVTMEKG